MAKRMAEIEQRAVSTFVFVPRDDVGFDLARPPDRVRQRGRVARQQTFGIRVEPVEELPIDDEAVLDDLGEPGAQLPVGKRRKRVGVCEYRCRLMERADEILAAWMIHAG